MVRTHHDDPLTAAMAPPPDETDSEREGREKREQEARRISDEIDEQIKAEKAALKKKRKPVKVLLLGQSESGKSATLKNFQLIYARREWAAERSSWRAVIQLNLLRNVNSIMNLLDREMTYKRQSIAESDEDSVLGDTTDPSLPVLNISPPPVQLTERHRLLKLRLTPLRSVQKDLERKLGAGSHEVYSTTVTDAAPFDPASPRSKKRVPQEFFINSSNGWKSALDKFRPTGRLSGGSRSELGGFMPRKGKVLEVDETTECIAGCAEDIKATWEDPVIRELLNRRGFTIEDSPGFFLNDAERIASRDYEPTDDDVIRARLRTIGVQEHKFIFEQGHTAGHEWIMYDVGGTRSSRTTWLSYFEDVDSIIFLAPISCFDENLAEDRTVNRLQDSYLLWRAVVSSKILAKTQIILFLNKCDLLQAKLKRGVKVQDHVPSYGNRQNDLQHVSKYFQQHFKDISKQHSPEPRTFHVYMTSIIDTKSTANTLGLVEEGILRDHLRRADLL